jgi:transposase-like protein
VDIISREAARSQGLTKFYTGKLCRKSHNSERYVSNGACLECTLDRGTAATADERELLRDHMTVSIDNRAVLSGTEQARALDEFSRTRSYEKAARALNLTPQQLQARRAANSAFDAAFRKLEANFAERPPVDAPVFRWSDEKRARLIDLYVDTGDIAEAREVVGVTPSEYLRELDRNAEFAQQIATAEPKAKRALEERATSLALRGNDKLLSLVLKAKNPEFRDSLRIEATTTVRLSDDQLDARIARLSRHERTIDADFTVDTSAEAGTTQLAGGKG